VIKNVRPLVTEFRLRGARRRSIYLLADGRLVNLSAATGHPASVMDMSFATQALCAEWIAKKGRRLGVAVHDVPAEIEAEVAKLKLHAMGIKIDKLTTEQVEYLASSGEGT
jgi:adenosylhomocysteinase